MRPALHTFGFITLVCVACGGHLDTSLGTDSGAATDGASAPPSYVCNDLENVAPLISRQFVPVSTPDFKDAGPPEPGTYILESAIAYTSPQGRSGSSGSSRITVRVEPDRKTFQFIMKHDDYAEETATFLLETADDGTSRFAWSCPPQFTAPLPIRFVATTPPGFSYDNGYIWVFRKIAP